MKNARDKHLSNQPPTLIHEGNNIRVLNDPGSEYGGHVVIKVLNTDYPTPQQLIRLNNEFELTKDLSIDGVRKAIAQIKLENKPALVMEYIPGQTLKQVFVEQKQSLLDFLKVAIHISKILRDVHQHYIIHGNINSNNILVNLETKQVRIIDFSLASRLDLWVHHLGNPENSAVTLAYISPEQTGRMNRTIDYRSDLYSLGVTFYEMLTRHLPFKDGDPLALMHAHIAKVPKSPATSNPNVPQILSDIVMRLLAKNAEDRYQSAFGLKADLERCLAVLTGVRGAEKLAVYDFELGQDDFSGQLHIPQKLYGRAGEIATLLSAFERVAAGSQELMLVAGCAGVGKSALVAEVHKPITGKRGYFISGKFDQYKQNIPYSAFAHAFNQLAEFFLTEPEIILQQWRDKILAATGDNGAVLMEIMPSLGNVIGPQPAVPRLDGQENRNRFNLTFRNFVQAISSSEHPLVVSIDDWQWADFASLELLKILLSGEKIDYLLLIGAYRDNEINQHHPLLTVINDLTAAGTAVQTINLGNLRMADVHQLIQESLPESTVESQALAEFVFENTQGNAFFTRQFLQNLYEEDWLRFDFNTRRWTWDIAQISAQHITDNVVELMAGRLKKFSLETGNLLQLAACIGNEFDLSTLALISRKNRQATLARLMEALIQGLVIPLNDYYKLPETAAHARFRFLHDRVQQAAYSLIPVSRKQSTHFNIAKLLLKNAAAKKMDEQIFEIVNHFNRALDQIGKPAERREVAGLNLKAGQKAREAAAFRTAWEYFTTARRLLPRDSWQKNYAFTLHLYELSVEAAYLSGELEAMEELFNIVLKYAKTHLDTIKVHDVKIQALTAQTKFLEAMDTGLEILKSMGIVFPKEPSHDDIQKAMLETQKSYQGIGIPELINLPLMTDPAHLAAMRILASILSTAFLSWPGLHALLVLKQVDLSVKYGNTPASAFCYASFGLVLCGTVSEIESGYQFGQLALDLAQRLNAKELQCKVPSVVHTFVTHWKRPVRDTLLPLRTAYYSGLENGDFQFAGYSGFLYIGFTYFAGIDKELAEVQRETESISESLRQLKQMTIFQYFEMLLQALHDLREGRTSSRYLQGDHYDEKARMPAHILAKDWLSIYYVYFHKLILNYLFGEYRQAVKDADCLKPYLNNARGFPYGPVFYLYDSLSRLAAYREKPPGGPDTLLPRIRANREKLETWARFAPMNCLHKVALIQAEQYRTFGDKAKAIEEYDRAISEAKQNGYWREEALANELAACFLLDWGRDKIAKIYMQKAYEGYNRWQARAKVQDLEKRYPYLIIKPAHSISTPNIAECEEVRRSLDFKSVLKASQVISSHIVLKTLLHRLMEIVLENAGAQNGCLVLEKDGNWVIVAEGTSDLKKTTKLKSIAVDESDTVCAAIIRYVVRTRESVVLPDAAEKGIFIGDPYVKRNKIKSVLCLPLLNLGRLGGVLYLENNLAADAFTPERIEVLELLAGQAAIALENAALYQQAQQEITERKTAQKELQESREHLKMVFDSVNDAIFVHEATSGNIMDVNEKMCLMYGYTREEALNLRVQDLSSGELSYTQQDALTWMKKAFEEGPQLCDWRAKDKSGRLFWVEMNMRRALIGGQDRIIVVVRDISERKRAEEALEKRIVALTRPLDTAEGISFEELFNLPDIQRLQDLFAKAFNVAALITRPDGTPITQPSNYSHLCGEIILKTRKGAENCFLSGRTIGPPNPRPTIRNCLSVGLCHAMVSIIVGGCNVANCLIGQVRNENLKEEKIIEYAREIGADETAFREAYYKVPFMPQEQFEKVAQLLFMIANQLSTSAFQNIQQARFITERNVAEAALRESRERFRLLVETTSDWVWEVDLNTVYTYVSPQVRDLLGYEPEEILGKTPFDLMSADEAKRVKLIFLETTASHKPIVRLENISCHKNGRQIILETSAIPFFAADGRMLGYRGIDRDITERKEAEKTEKILREQLFQSQKMETVGLLAGGVAHDFNNLLTPIIGYSELLLLNLPTGDANRKMLEQIHQVAELAKGLTTRLLTFSRKQMLELQPVKVEDIIWEFERMLHSAIRENIEIKIMMEPARNFVYADRAQIEQALLNLAINAQDSMPKGGKLTIEVTGIELDKSYAFSHPEVTPGAYVMFSMSDTGLGMDKDTLEHIFEPFFTTKELGRGTGLGLSTVYGIVKQHGGSISVYSEKEHGSTFKIFLPRISEAGAWSKEQAVKNDVIERGDETILVVEDNESVRNLVFGMLKDLGYNVLMAENVDACLEIAKKYDGIINLLLTDVIMPVMNGKELYKLLKQERPGIKVAFMSGYTDNVIGSHGVLDQDVVFLQKPFTLSNLSQKVRKALEG